jgi:hypothetical protein
MRLCGAKRDFKSEDPSAGVERDHVYRHIPNKEIYR